MEIKKIKKTLIENYYIHMRNGAIHEIKREGKSLENIIKDIRDKGILIFKKENLIINSVDIVEITNFINYVKWVNQKRPKSFVVGGALRILNKEEIYWERQMKYVKGWKKQVESERLKTK